MSHDSVGANPTGSLDGLEYTGPPTTTSQLDARVAAIADALDIPVVRAKFLVTSIVLAQMLPGNAIVKGGIGIKLRLGETGTRATTDLDVAARNEDAFRADLTERLAAGWGTIPPSRNQLKKDADAAPNTAFTGVMKLDRKASPAGVPERYVMQPYHVTLYFRNNGWGSVTLEVAHDELDGIDYTDQDTDPADQVTAIAAVLGFGHLKPVPLISLELQIAQKIHAVTEPQSQRAHDLVDLQLLWHAGTSGEPALDLSLLSELCERTFQFRERHSWPPSDFSMPDLLDEAYQKALREARPAADGVDPQAETAGPTGELAASLQEAADWLNDRIAELAPTDGQG